MQRAANRPGTITLIGSGELAPGGVALHRAVLDRIEGAARPVFVDTPAGFELNVRLLGQRAVAYFDRHFGLPLRVAHFPHATRVSPLMVAEALAALAEGNYLLAGPGSPTYTVRHWRGTAVWQSMLARLGQGAHLLLASAAALAISRWTLPVYEIYKAGAELGWVEGLDLLGGWGLALAVVPHWNNNSGAGFDTSRCYVGQQRLAALLAMLPPHAVILGIDEYTACHLDLVAERAYVLGMGSVTICRGGSEEHFHRGASFPLTHLRPVGEVLALPPPPPVPATPDWDEATLRDAFYTALITEGRPAVAVGVIQAALSRQPYAPWPLLQELLGALAGWLQHTPPPRSAGDATQLVALLVALRETLRHSEQWALADTLRADLAHLGVLLEDTSQGPRWSWRSPPP